MANRDTTLWLPRPKMRRRSLRRLGLLSLVPAAIGFSSAGHPHTETPAVIVQADEISREAPLPSETHRGLPSLEERLPKMGTPEFAARMRAIGLSVEEVRQFARIARAEKKAGR